jgi:5-methylcytosine-specific restriction enzyme subunit McrC
MISIKKGRREVLFYTKIESYYHISLSYFIGVDWIDKNQAIYIEPKLNKDVSQTNDLQMLFSALKHPEIAQYTDDLVEIKWEGKQIEITQQQDLLTPLLVVQFLQVVQQIVRKGLKKSYYKVEQNLYSKVKGKILVGQTIKQNLLKNKPLNTFCTYDEFGVNILENRL